MNSKQKSIHDRALIVFGKLKSSEWDAIKILREVEQSKTHKAMGKPSLFSYATEILGLDEAQAYSLITLARKCTAIPAGKGLGELPNHCIKGFANCWFDE